MSWRITGAGLAAVTILAGALPALGHDDRLLQAGVVRLEDDFERGLEHWTAMGGAAVRIGDSGDPAHGRVMVLDPAGDVLALVRGSEQWGAVRLEGEVLFPTEENSYLGVAYHHQRQGDRRDFGLIYIKGNDSYVQANPHRDFNVGRTLYPEFNVPLTGDAAIQIGTWQRFRVEVDDTECHFYVGDTSVPQITFPLFERTSGQVGLQPRSVGGPVWVNNVRVTSIDRLSYRGPGRPSELVTPADDTITTWEAMGPLDRTRDEVARHPDVDGAEWQPFATDARGAVVTGRLVDYHGPRTVGYFRARVESPGGGEAHLQLSTVDDLAIWIGGRFHWFVSRGSRAWPDFATNPDHAGQSIPMTLQPGTTDIVIRVRGGVYASGGFFARVVRD